MLRDVREPTRARQARCMSDRVMSASNLTRRGWSGLALALAVLCVTGPAAAQAPATAANPAAGAQLFETRGCQACHAADLARLRERSRSLPALAAAMWNHFPVMAERIRRARMPTPYLTSSELRNLVAFLAPAEGDRAGADDRRLLGEGGDPARGRQVVTQKGCLGCHSIAPPRGERAGNLADLKGLESPWTVVAQMWNHAFLMELETQGQKVAWAPMTAVEMADLVAYLEALMRAR
jgi:mono/diheme cytochrome c family protein